MMSACSCALRLLEPVAGDAEACRETTRTDFMPRLASSIVKNGHAPWFSGSSCTHTSSAFE